MNILTYETELDLFLAVLEVSVFAHRLRQLTRDVKSDVRFQKRRHFCSTPKNTEWRSEKVVMRRKMSKMKEMTND